MSGKKSIIKLIEENRDEILRIAKKHGASNVRIFGSVARGEDGPDTLSNLRPLQWQNNVDKSDGRLRCNVTASGKDNVQR